MYNLDSGERRPLNGSLNYNTILQLELFCQKSVKWDKMPYLEVFFSLHDTDAGLKENRLMVQRKENLHVKNRSSEKRDQKDLDVMTAVSMVRVPTALLDPGDLPPYLAKGTGESAPELVSPSQTRQGTKFGGGKAPTRAGQYPLWRLAVGVEPEGQPARYY